MMGSRLPVIGLGQPGVRVRTLAQLRWAAIIGQLVALFVTGVLMGYPIPWAPALAAVGASVSLNLGVYWLYRRRDQLEGRAAVLQLGFDLAQVATLLFLTGGLDNPFALLLLVPVTIAATILSARATALMLAFALVLLVLLWRWSLPLPWDGTPPVLPGPYRLGLLVAIGLGMIFLAFYAWQVSAEARRRQAALVATQAALERESRMGALGALAAAAAHELGGPLGTITLIAHDLTQALGDDPDFGHDIRLLGQETTRAREILTSISERAEAEDPFPELPLPVLLHEVVEPFEPTRVPLVISVPWSSGEGPVIRRSPELLHGLSNLLSNALRHADQRVDLEAGETATELWLSVSDDGTGFEEDLLPRLGEPFLGPSWSGSGSTGLGIFIATTLLERTGGRLRFSNRPQGGAKVELRWLRTDIELSARQDRAFRPANGGSR